MGRSKDSIHKKAEKLGLKSFINSRITVFYNENYFKTPTLENSYWAGLLAADGCVDNKRNTLSIDLAEKDRNLLEKLKVATKYSGDLKIYNNNISYETDQKRIRLCFNHAAKFNKDLFSHFSIMPRKSLTFEYPKLKNKKLIKAFLIGFIDGDGCISVNKNGNKLYLKIAVTSGLGNWLNYILPMLYGIKQMKLTSRGKIFYYALSDRTALKVLNDLNKINVPKLLRKWNNLKIYNKHVLKSH